MLYLFKSKVTGDVIMLQPNGERLLEIIGKRDAATPGIKGILLPEQMPLAISNIEAAIAGEESTRRETVAQAQKQNQPAPHFEAVNLRQRALPLMEMIRTCQKANEPIVWGV